MTARANTALSRRAVLGGLVAAATSASPALSGEELGGAGGAAHAADYSAADRLRHHLLMASLALDELAPGADSRWRVVMCGKAGAFAPGFFVERFDTAPDPEITWLKIENATEICRWPRLGGQS